jgi:hypothetical protein
MNKVLVVVPAVVAAGIAYAPLAYADGNTANLDQLIGQLYTQVMQGCQPQTPANFQGIQWDPGSPYGGGGSGRIIDGNPSFGGPFEVLWGAGPQAPAGYRVVPAQPNGYWDINFEFC